jgi:deoxyribodipyrimidine photolyase-related protein
MKKILLIFPHQLFDPKSHKTIFQDVNEIYVIEDSLFFGDQYVKIPFHKSKLVFHRASMTAFYDELSDKMKDTEKETKIIYHDYQSDTETIEKIIEKIGLDNEFRIIDPTDYLLEKRIRRVLPDVKFVESPLFINTKSENVKFCENKENFLMHHFYQHQRKRLNIMVDSEGKATGRAVEF